MRANTTPGHAHEQGKARTPAIRRAVDVLWGHTDRTEDLHALASDALAAALDVEEITEALAREQWNTMHLVAMGELARWEDADDALLNGARYERKHFRDRVRPFAVAVRRTILGEGA